MITWYLCFLADTILTSTHTTGAIPSIRLWADTIKASVNCELLTLITVYSSWLLYITGLGGLRSPPPIPPNHPPTPTHTHTLNTHSYVQLQDTKTLKM